MKKGDYMRKKYIKYFDNYSRRLRNPASESLRFSEIYQKRVCLLPVHSDNNPSFYNFAQTSGLSSRVGHRRGAMLRMYAFVRNGIPDTALQYEFREIRS